MSDEVRVPLSVVRDSNLSWGAKGALFFLVSASAQELSIDKFPLHHFGAPRDYLSSADLIIELIEAGYLQMKPDADLDGSFSDIFDIHIQTPNTAL